MTIFEALRVDHETLRKLSDSLLDSSGDSEERQNVYHALREELILHAKAEERCLYIPMMESDMAQEKARHSVAEHHEIDEYLEELDDSDMSSPHWLAVMKKLHHRLHHHLDEEEHEIFQIAGKALSGTMKEQLGEEYKLMTAADRGQVDPEQVSTSV